MVEYINFCVCNFVFSLSAMLILKKIFHLEAKNIYLVILQLFSLSASAIYLFCGVSFFVFLILEIFALTIMCLLVTDKYSFYNITIEISVLIVLFFAMLGLYNFLYLFFEAVIKNIFNKKIAKYYKFVVILAIFLQYFIINAIIDFFKEEKINKQILTKVSFFINNQHIEITGLIDSGNSVFAKNNKPVIMVSISVIKKYLSEENYEYITKLLKFSDKIICKMISGSTIELPVIDSKNIVVKIAEKKVDCAIAVLQNAFYDESEFECLLHKNFM